MVAERMSIRNIHSNIKDLYNSESSPESIGSNTVRIVERAKEWQIRVLDL